MEDVLEAHFDIDDNFSDIILHSETKKFHLHSLVLIRSKYFEKMLNSGLLEAQKHEINMRDKQDSLVHALLRYIYFGTISQNLATDSVEGMTGLVRLALMADELLLPSLVDKCVGQLLKSSDEIRTKDLIAILEIAEKNREIFKAFRRATLQTIRSRNSDEIGCLRYELMADYLLLHAVPWSGQLYHGDYMKLINKWTTDHLNVESCDIGSVLNQALLLLRSIPWAILPPSTFYTIHDFAFIEECGADYQKLRGDIMFEKVSILFPVPGLNSSREANHERDTGWTFTKNMRGGKTR